MRNTLSTIRIRLYTDHLPVCNMATVRLDQKSRALVRAVPDSFPNALAKFFGTKLASLARLFLSLGRLNHYEKFNSAFSIFVFIM